VLSAAPRRRRADVGQLQLRRVLARRALGFFALALGQEDALPLPCKLLDELVAERPLGGQAWVGADGLLPGAARGPWFSSLLARLLALLAVVLADFFDDLLLVGVVVVC
jgi:hypothetical protein